MMAPRTSLLLWTALVVVPMAGWLVWAPGPLPAGILAAWAGAAVWDARRSRCDVAWLQVRAPDTVRLARGRADEIVLDVCGDAPRPGTVRIGLAAPEALGISDRVREITVKTGRLKSRTAWDAAPAERGRFRIEHCHVESPSRWGLWHIRARVQLDIDVRVYPGLLSERRRVPALFLRRGVVGIRHQRRFGKGREFEQLRDYLPGDSIEDIHWKATAKRGYPVTKMYQIERTQEVYVGIDASRLSGRRVPATTEAPGPTEEGRGDTEPLIERYINSALLLGRAAEMQGDLFGLLTFSDRLQSFVRARRGHGHYRACLDAVCRLKSRPVAPDFGEVCSFVRHRLRRRALIVLLTQLDDPVLAENLLHDVEYIRRQHVVLVCMPCPPVVRPLFSVPEGVTAPDDIYAALGGHLRWQQLRRISDALQKKGVGFLLSPDEAMLTELIARYLNIKQRQIL